MKIKPRPYRDLWNLHSHSRFSSGDALPEVRDMVKTVARYGQPALGLTDHGNMAGTVQLYKECRKEDLLPFPGTELYVVRDRSIKKGPAAKRHHMCVLAYTSKGYENLVGLSTLSHKNFHNKPLVDHTDLAVLSEQGLLEGLVATSGCYFGYIGQAFDRGDYDDAQALMSAYAGWFCSSGGLFVAELQNHRIDHGNGHNDDWLADEVWTMASRMGLPCVVTQDSHYCHPEDRPVHDALKRLVAFGNEEDDAVFPGDGFHLADNEWFMQRHYEHRLIPGHEGLSMLLEKHDLKIPELDHYSYTIPFTTAEPQRVLREKCLRTLSNNSMTTTHLDRLSEELAIIEDTGMAGYLLMIEEITDWCRANDVYFQARGSASGSMVCWLLGITQLDPLKWGISFDRFISRDRTKPPDIDLDVEHSRRQDIIEWLETRFAVHQIGTWQIYSINGSEEDEDGQRGSLRVKYFARKRATDQPIEKWEDVPAHDKEMLRLIAEKKTTSHSSTHAAGLVLTTTQEDFHRLVPLMWNTNSEILVTQYDMKDVETLGLVKVDLLGVKTLTVIHKALDNLGRDFREGLDWIPLTDDKTYRAIGAGKTDGVFQLEGWASRRGCRDLKPTKISDIIASMALFRPATMNSGATKSYIARKHREEEPAKRHEIIERNTKDTHGIMLYQEQVLNILRDLGMNPEDRTLFLKAVKSSNDNVTWARGIIDKFKPWVEDACQQAGFDQNDWIWLWAAIEGFGEYGFNLAHSSVYGLTAYRTAYLATNYPLEYFAALLNVFAGSSKNKKTQTSKEDDYIKAARERGLRIMAASINGSGISYEVDANRKGIRRGLMGIKGIGRITATEIVDHRPEDGYASLRDMCMVVNRRKITGAGPYLETGVPDVGIINTLNEYGAFDFEE